MATDYTQDANIRAYWYFEESSSPSLDGTANNNDLTWTGAAANQDTSLFKQGASSIRTTAETGNLPTLAHASVSSNFPFKAVVLEFTIGGWLRIAATSSFTFFYYGQAGEGPIMTIDGTGKIDAAIRTESAVNADAAASINTWYHVVYRWNGENRSGAGANDELSLWINGVKQTSTLTTTNPAEVTGGELRFYGAATNNFWFDEWFVFDKALLDTQIADIYNYRLDGSLGTIPESRRIMIVRAG